MRSMRVRALRPTHARAREVVIEGTAGSRFVLPPVIDSGIAEDGRSYREQHRLEVVSPTELIRVIASAAKGHFSELSGDYSDVPRSAEMRELGLSFFLTRLTIDFFGEPPRAGQAVEVETFFRPARVSFRRDFVIRDAASGAVVAAATSTYVLVNLETRRLGRAPKAMVDSYADYFAGDGGRFAEPRLPSKSKIAADVPRDAAHAAVTFVVAPRDIDRNGHVEATVYIEWLLESIGALRTNRTRAPKKEGKEEEGVEGMEGMEGEGTFPHFPSTLTHLDVEYKQECFLGQEIVSLAAHAEEAGAGAGDGKDGDGGGGGDGGMAVDHVVATGEGETLIRAKTRWTHN